MSITTGTGLASKAKLKSYCIAKGLKSKIMHQFLCKARSKGNLNFIRKIVGSQKKKQRFDWFVFCIARLIKTWSFQSETFIKF